MSDPTLMPTPQTVPCIILIGMAGAGKSTVGKELAKTLDWAFLDSDHLIEAAYALPLENIVNSLGKDTFLEVECTVIRSLRLSRTVIATGGSVIYREEAMRHLTSLGTLVYLDVPFAVIEDRLNRNPQRGLAIAPGQTLHELFTERQQRYRAWAHLRIEMRDERPCESAGRILRHLPKIGANNSAST